MVRQSKEVEKVKVVRVAKKRSSAKKVLKKGYFKKYITPESVDYALIIMLVVIIVGAMLFIAYTILSFNFSPPDQKINVTSRVIPTWAPPSAFIPMGVKAIGAEQLPKGCENSKDSCWKRAVADGVVKFIETEAKILLPEYENKEIVFAYFKNTSKVFGTSGLYNCLPVYKEDGRPIGSEIFGGVNFEIDWVYGTNQGVIIHDKLGGRCYEQYFNIESRAWLSRAVACPK